MKFYQEFIHQNNVLFFNTLCLLCEHVREVSSRIYVYYVDAYVLMVLEVFGTLPLKYVL